MTDASLRIYYVTHENGHLTGYLMRHRELFWDRPPPAAYGDSESDVRAQLQLMLQERLVSGEDELSRYLFTAPFSTRTVSLVIHPSAVVDKTPVIGKREVPLRVTYAYTQTKSSTYRVMLPRFRWMLMLEDLSTAPRALADAISSALLGAAANWIYDFRETGDEYVREWSAQGFTRRGKGAARTIEEEFPVLTKVADEWVTRAGSKKLARPVGDLPFVDRLFPQLLEEPRPSFLLVGGNASGKSTAIRGFAHRFLKRKRKGKDTPRLWATSAERMLAGMIYVGMWQERCLEVLEALRGEGSYLYVDHLLDLMRPLGDGGSVGDLIEPAVKTREIAILAECTPEELTVLKRDHASMLAELRVVHLDRVSRAEMLPLMKQYAQRKKINAHPLAVKRAIHHLDTLRPDLHFPGKGFLFFDWLAQESSSSATEIYPPRMTEHYSRFSGLPVELIADEYPATTEDIAAALSKRVIGQPAACRASAQIITPFKAGLNAPDKPIGSLFFVGPTGVGKTELAKGLARYLFGDPKRMLRFDMSEFMSYGSAQRLLAVGRGRRSLAQEVRRNPLSLILFDEIEKAHPEVFDLLLGVLGEGRLTDARGAAVDFRMTIIIMTSNLGVSSKEAVGFSGDGRGSSLERAVREHFRPEFFNRIDQLVSFRALDPGDVRRITDLLLDEVIARAGFARRGITLAISDRARDRLAERGYDRAYGARPLRRVIEERLVTPLAVRMSADPSFKNRTVEVLAAGERAKPGAIVID